MTMKVQEQVVQIERKQHPNSVRYPCRSTHEILEAGRKFITSLSQPERLHLKDGNLILEEEETGELFDEIKENDIIGLGVLKPDGFYANTYRVEKIHKEDDWLECENAYTKMFEEISFQDVSVAMALGFAEILYRDDKPFGVSSHYDFTIKYEVEETDTDTEDSSADQPTDQNQSLSSENSENTDITENDSEPLVEFNECYFSFKTDEDTVTPYVIFTPVEYWDNKNKIPTENLTQHLADKLGLDKFEENCYEYNHKYTETQLRQLLIAFKSKEKTDISFN